MNMQIFCHTNIRTVFAKYVPDIFMAKSSFSISTSSKESFSGGNHPKLARNVRPSATMQNLENALFWKKLSMYGSPV